ncbi:MAG: ABC transporter permease [Candidatus Nitricoxidivorans perseverans]|uniref:ABC transporter permease n=1 Tax=Candidatus Nitricoxidivorans perseverans TaxID=2975601 RepID=A0AA49FJJ9_9PROT|nr:MAG: ABC transporter permease [Candidatus Nitricoxidivorans perseverans]
MISLAARDIGHHLGRFVLTGVGLGLLIGVTLTMAGVYRGMVADGNAVIAASGADLWVVQKDTLGPWAEPSSIRDDVYRTLAVLPGVAEAANVAYLTLQVSVKGRDVRVMVAGVEPGALGEPAQVVAGRPLMRSHYEAVADEKTGLAVGDTVRIRRHDYKVVGLARRATSSSGDPMLFIPIKDAQEIQFLKDNDSIIAERARTAANPSLNRPGAPGLLDAVLASQTTSHNVNAVLIRVSEDHSPDEVKAEIGRWKHLTAWTRANMEDILVAKLIATSAKQIGMFLVILAIVSAAIVAFIIYTMTMNKLREIAVLKLIGARDRSIAAMILQQALALGLIGFVVGKVAATIWAPFFPKHVLLEPGDAARGLAATVVVCALASVLAIRAALKVDPAEAIGG